MGTATQSEIVTIRRDEIKSLAEEADLTQAMRRLLDFARDFSNGRENVNEAVTLVQRLNKVRQSQRGNLRPHTEIDLELTQVARSALELTDRIHDKFLEDLAPEADSPEREGAQADVGPKPPASPPQGIATGETKTARTLTRLEEARRLFKPTAKTEVKRSNDTVFWSEGLRKEYTGATDFVLSDISMELKRGEIMGLVGLNGSGKTTLLRIIAGWIQHTSGGIGYPLLDAGSLDWASLKRNLVFVPQSLPSWRGPLVDNLHFHASCHGVRGKENEEETEFVLQRLGLEPYRDARWAEISAGYQMRFQLARALVCRPKLLVLDEPLAPLDMVSQQIFLRDLRDLADSSRFPLPIVVSSQHIYEIESIADKMLVLDRGQPISYGMTSELGERRSTNVFEMSCSEPPSQLYEILSGLPGLYPHFQFDV